RGQLGRRGPGRIDARHHVRAALRGERLVERGAGVHGKSKSQNGGTGGHQQHQADHDRLPPLKGHPAPHRTANRGRPYPCAPAGSLDPPPPVSLAPPPPVSLATPPPVSLAMRPSTSWTVRPA